MNPLRVLIVETASAGLEDLHDRLRGPVGSRARVTVVRGTSALRDALESGGHDIVLSGPDIPGWADAAAAASGVLPYRIVAVRPQGGVAAARAALLAGADDLVAVPPDTDELEAALERFIESSARSRRGVATGAGSAELARLRGEFIANVSHEIRTPMNAIVGFAHLARDEDNPTTRDDYLHKIEKSARLLMSMVEDLLDLSRLDAGRLTIEPAPFRLSELLADTIDLVDELIRVKSLALLVDIGPRVPRRMVGDARRIGQVLLSYLSNAVKFTPAGRITVAAALDAEGPEGCVLRLSVRDTGIGLEPEARERVFDAFEQADGSNTRRHGGAGLGLSIARRLSGLMGGEVGVDSVPGRGSCFWFTVRLGVQAGDERDWMPEGLFRHAPSAPAEALRPAGGASPAVRRDGHAPDLRGLRVLLVEDNDLNIEVARGLLARTGAEVDVAVDGEQAVASAAAHDYGLVLMDLQMPVMDGLEATRRIRAGATRSDLPIIAMTASALPNEAQRCLDAGLNDLVLKPIAPSTLYATLARWCPVSGAAPRAASSDPEHLAIDGLDPQVGLAAVLGQKSLYLRMLRRFATTQAGAAATIRSACHEGDLATAARAAHTVKGICRTVGAMALAHDAEALELALGGSSVPPGVDTLIDRFEAGLLPMCEAIVATVPAAS